MPIVSQFDIPIYEFFFISPLLKLLSLSQSKLITTRKCKCNFYWRMPYQHMNLKKTGRNAPGIECGWSEPLVGCIKLIVQAKVSGLTLSTASQGNSQFSTSSNKLMACSFITKQHLSLSPMREFIYLCLMNQHAEAFTHNLVSKPLNIYTIPPPLFFAVIFLLKEKKKRML